MAKRATTIGLHGHRILGLLYRFGTLTRVQLTRLTGLSEWAVDRQLKHLKDSGLVAEARDVAGWKGTATGRPKSAYYLAAPNGVKAGAYEVGIENDYLALRHYRRIRLPGTTAHRLLANEYLIAVSEAAGDEIRDEETFAESSPGLPLFSTGRPKSDRENSPYKFGRVVPDSTFVLKDLRYYVEAETRLHGRPELTKKFSDYGGRGRRLLKPSMGERRFFNPRAVIEPMVLLTPTNQHKRLRTYLRKHLPETEDWNAATEAIREASGGRAHPLQLILVAGLDEVRHDPLGRHYRPLRKYPPELSDPASDGTPGWRVSLADAAEISSRIPIPEKPPEPEALEGLDLEDDSKKENVA